MVKRWWRNCKEVFSLVFHPTICYSFLFPLAFRKLFKPKRVQWSMFSVWVHRQLPRSNGTLQDDLCLWTCDDPGFHWWVQSCRPSPPNATFHTWKRSECTRMWFSHFMYLFVDKKNTVGLISFLLFSPEVNVKKISWEIHFCDSAKRVLDHTFSFSDLGFMQLVTCLTLLHQLPHLNWLQLLATTYTW